MTHPLHKKCLQGIMKVKLIEKNKNKNKTNKKDNNSKYPVPDNYHTS